MTDPIPDRGSRPSRGLQAVTLAPIGRFVGGGSFNLGSLTPSSDKNETQLTASSSLAALTEVYGAGWRK